jgi:hypothetical protein
LAARALAFTTSALIEDAIMVFPCFRRILEEYQRVNDLRQRPEKPMACALQIAKQADYSPKPPVWHPRALMPRQAPDHLQVLTSGRPSPTPSRAHGPARKRFCRRAWHHLPIDAEIALRQSKE